MGQKVDFFATDIFNDDDWEPKMRQAIEENSAEFKQAEKRQKIANEATLAAQAAAQQQTAEQTAVVPTIVNRIERMSGQEWTNVLLVIIIVLLVLILIFK
ncbi:MAG: hypothetical protein K5860_06610 [Bacteroidales bacterium]|nr:hypothetical protein [Bacteroidales bacterium]